MKGKEKEKIVSQPVPESVRIGALLAETATLIAQTQAALAGLPAEKLPLLAAAQLDADGLARVDQQARAYTIDLADLETRRGLLTQQLWRAETDEAAVRVQEIVTECGRLVTAATTALAALDECQAVLLTTLATVVDIHVQHLRLTKERNWLTASYRLPAVEVPRLAEFDPAPALQHKMGGICERLHQERLQLPPKRKQKPDDGGVFAEG
jgi:hypothetical protein